MTNIRTIILIKDLMLKSKIKEWQSKSGLAIEFVRSPEEAINMLSDGAHLVVDLSLISGELSSFIANIKGRSLTGINLTGFGSHVDKELLQNASEVGFEPVLPRSKFFGDIGRWLGKN